MLVVQGKYITRDGKKVLVLPPQVMQQYKEIRLNSIVKGTVKRMQPRNRVQLRNTVSLITLLIFFISLTATHLSWLYTQKKQLTCDCWVIKIICVMQTKNAWNARYIIYFSGKKLSIFSSPGVPSQATAAGIPVAALSAADQPQAPLPQQQRVRRDGEVRTYRRLHPTDNKGNKQIYFANMFGLLNGLSTIHMTYMYHRYMYKFLSHSCIIKEAFF